MRILFWFRKDLRLDDNTGLHEAVQAANGDVVPFYTSESSILGREDMAGVRVQFVLDSLAALADDVAKTGSRLALTHGRSIDTVMQAARAVNADAVYWNDEYEPALRQRDDMVESALRTAGIRTERFHDRLLVPPGAVQNKSGEPFKVYTPFRKACELLPIGSPWPAVAKLAKHDLPDRKPAKLEQLGFELNAPAWPAGAKAAHERLQVFIENALDRYGDQRDFMAVDGTSQLSHHLRFGTISPRTIAHAVREAIGSRPGAAQKSLESYISELRWRDFYTHILYHFPHVVDGSFKLAFDALEWPGEDAWFDAWCNGMTGYPVVDAAMRQLKQTGWMHNRARMIVASFLTKDLQIDWRKGELHFMKHLVDGDPASNNGGWQWAASTGTDAQPTFRIFNPILQGKKFDPDGEYVRRYVPELAKLDAPYIHEPWEVDEKLLAAAGIRLGDTYPERIVDHFEQRDVALARYGAIKK